MSQLISSSLSRMLFKENMADMKATAATDLALLELGYYAGIELLGYYEKGDKEPVVYYWNPADLRADNGGNIIALDTTAAGRMVGSFTNRFNVLDFGAKGNGSQDDLPFIQAAVNAAAITNEIFFPNVDEINGYQLSGAITIPEGHNELTLRGNYTRLKLTSSTESAVFSLQGLGSPYQPQRNVNIKGFHCELNTTTHQFMVAENANHIHVSDCFIRGARLGFRFRNCYFATIEKVMMDGIYQAFDFRNATNAFNIIGTSVHGAGIPSIFMHNTMGGNISGCSFESTAGRLRFDLDNRGMNISGNYFEGYSESEIDSYIDISNYVDYEGSTGFNISGNIFHTGALSGVRLNKAGGIAITGNTFICKHALQLYTFDGSIQVNVHYKGNFYKYEGTSPGASEFYNYGNGTGNFTAFEQSGTTYFEPPFELPASTATENILFNSEGKMQRKFNNVKAVMSSELVLWEGLTTASSTINILFDVNKMARTGKVYIVGSLDDSYNEYMYFQNIDNSNTYFLKSIHEDFSNLTLAVASNAMNFTDNTGGRNLRIVLKA